MPAGRPSSYTPEIAEEICAKLEQGIDLEQICREEHMPARRTIHSWLEGKNESVPREFSAAYGRARDLGQDFIGSNLRRVARGEEGHSSGDVVRDRLIIETDLKLLAKWNPKAWGEQAPQSQLPTGNTVQLIIMPSGTSPAEVDRTIDVSAPRLHGIVSESGAE